MKILLVLPLALLALGFLLGMARLYRTLIFFVCWLGLCAVFYISSMVYGFAHFDPGAVLVGTMVTVLLALPSVWFATLFSFATSKHINPAPIEQAYGVYQTLDDSQKKQVHQWAKVGLRYAAKHGSTYLRNKGYHASADALGDAAKHV